MLKSALTALPRGGRQRGRDTREEILNAAEELLQRRGYNAFSYHHIAVQLGIRNAAIHYHFAGKEDLGVALVQRFRERFRDWAELAAESDSAWDRLRSHFQTYIDYLEAGEGKCCPGGVLGSEFHSLPEPIRAEARHLMREVNDWLVDTLKLGQSQKTFQFPGRAEDKAVELCAALQGALQIARIAGGERFHQTLDQLTLELTGKPARH